MACTGNTVTCSCNTHNGNTGTTTNIYGTPGSDVRTQTSWTDPGNPVGKTLKATHLVQMQTAMTTELSIRSLGSGGWGTITAKSTKITFSEMNKIKTAINNCRSKDGGSAFGWDSTTTGSKLSGGWINSVRGYINTLQNTCICNCNYCTCNCNYCTCNCNYCTCNCNYCTCNCNYKCTCNCNYG